MQRKKKRVADAARAPQGLAPPAPDPRHPEAVLDTVPRAAGIDVHKMSLTCTVLVEDDRGHVASETRQYRTYGAELRLLVGWLAGWPVWTWRGWSWRVRACSGSRYSPGVA